MPSETIVAVFETARAAEAAVAALIDGGVSENAIHRYNSEHDDGGRTGDYVGDPAAAPAGTTSATGASLDEPPARTAGGGFWGWLTGEKDEHTHHHDEYERSLGTGHQVVTVITEQAEASFVLDILDRHDPLNLEERGPGLTGGAAPSTGLATGGTTATGFASPASGRLADDETVPLSGATTSPLTDTTAGTTSASGTAATGTAAPLGTGATTGTGFGTTTGTGVGTEAGREEVLALSEEELEVGKRQIDRGTTRIRRYVVERPVEEQIRLRDEAVSVFRRPVARRAVAGSDAFTDRTVEMTETDEEAVVAKKAFVSEEVVLRKDVEERDQVVRDTLRKEEVEITGPGGTAASGGTTGTTGPKRDL